MQLTEIVMKSSRSILLSGTLLSMAAYALAIWGEAARNAAGLGFNERFGVARLAEGFGKVTFHDLGNLQFHICEYLGMAGMIAALLVALLGMRRISKWVPTVYFVILTALGGWAGLLLALYLPWFLFCLATDPLPMDGEFFADGAARCMGGGVWMFFLLGWTLKGFIKWRPAWMSAPETPRHV